MGRLNTQTPPNGVAVAGQPGDAVEQSATVYDGIQTYLAGREKFLAEALGDRMDVTLFLGQVMQAVRKTPALARCTPSSLMGAAVTAAQVGLMPGPLGHFYLTPRENRVKVGPGRDDWEKRWEVVPIIGYRGYIVLARRGSNVTIDADARWRGDRWIYRRGTDPYLETAPAEDDQRGDIVGYWAAAKFGGGTAQQYMSLGDLMAHARKYAWNSKYDRPQGFANTNWEAWCLKTVIRQMTWKLPLSVEMQTAVDRDEQAVHWRDEDAELVVTDAADDAADEQQPDDDAGEGEGLPPVHQDPTLDPNYSGGRA